MKHKYQQVKDKIIQWGIDEKYKLHEKLPTESQLMELFNVSRHTIRKALSDLLHEQYIYTIQGSGVYLSDWKNIISIKSNKTIGILTTYISDYIFPEIIRGLEDTLYAKSYSMLLSSTNNNIMFESNNLKNLLAHRIDGLIIEPTKSAYQGHNTGYFSNLIKHNIPFIMINASYEDVKVPSLLVNDFKGGSLACEHLLNLGHKYILGIFKVDDSQGIQRMNGFISSYQKNNMHLNTIQIMTYLSEEISDILPQKIKSSLESKNRPTAIFCYNDQIAITAMNIAKTLDLSVPKDLSIIGFDDSALCEIIQPNLTSITHPKKQMGIDAANLITKLIDNNNNFDDSDSIIYEPTLIVRNSTSKPNQSIN
ncbi:GntR family transcriptional regulator [Clostridium tyrobutyricum]|uniref:GntR family transcriptional regulator n=1 Tax=Clostridium tyrobutyricum TaxID=1519 RepID=UPI00057F2EDC|nr:GntR family transcriptional regulator [Clostridium tyrobutyricum]